MLAALLGLVGSLALAAGDCKLTRIAEWPVDAGGGVPVIEGAINGTRLGVALDTGASVSRIAGSAADRLGLARREASGLYALSSGELAVDATSVKELRLGGSVLKDWGRLIVQGPEGRDYAVVLGQDFFQQFDVEFDLPHNAVRLFQPQDCGDASLAYWVRESGQVRLERDPRRPAIVVPVKLNGKAASAVLSSGTPQSVVSGAFATPPFETFAVGDELIRNPALGTADLGRRDMLLGLDFLRAHRVLVSNRQGKVYFTYAGGRVFETPR